MKIDSKKEKEFMQCILHGRSYGIEVCKLIMCALSYDRRIPDSFWEDEEKGAYGILGFRYLTKSEVRELRYQLSEILISKITEMEKDNKSQVDNFARAFHALTILKVNKDTLLVPNEGENYIYNVAYNLWKLDNGSDNVWRTIEKVAWYSSEAIKNKE